MGGICLNDIYLSGSRSKGTAITLSSDFDLFISLKPDTDNTLKEIYESLKNYLDHKGLETRTFSIPRNVIPKNAVEGDVLNIHLTINKEETGNRRKKIKGLMDELFE